MTSKVTDNQYARLS